MLTDADEIVSKYDELRSTDASPVLIAAVLLWFAIAVQHTPPGALSQAMQAGTLFIKKVSDTIEDAIVRDDALAGSIEGIETSLLWTRL